MKCPACGNALQERTVGEITVDVCKGGCGGIWFDPFELRKVDDPHEVEGEGLLDIERDEGIVVDYEARRTCPRCEGIVMMRHFFGVKRHVEVDECPRCAGLWLDHGELGRIRSQFASEAEKNQATHAWLANTVDQKLDAMRAENQAQLERAQRFARMFRFICPSYYIPGKQAGAAF